MFEKVNPSHPDKIADRIAGAIVDLCYERNENPQVAAEVLVGHGVCNIICETSERLPFKSIANIVHRLAGDVKVYYKEIPQDTILARNQENEIHCGDNGIFKGVPVTDEQNRLCHIAKDLYKQYPSDGKFILDDDKLIICQSEALTAVLLKSYPFAEINPLGEWTGGLDVDTGATNRKLGSDMADSVTGGGLHGKDLSKADVSLNIYCFLKAQRVGKPVELSCAIGDLMVDGRPYKEIVKEAKNYIASVGGFEKFAEWGLVR